MNPTPPIRSRTDELDWIAWSSFEGSLGLFIGTGFSKAATAGRAPSFEQLLHQLSRRLNLSDDFDRVPYNRKSFPQIASQLLHDYSRANNFDERAPDRFRQEIAQLCHFVPDPQTAIRLAPALQSTAPAWIITTNYDLVIECLLEGRGPRTDHAASATTAV